MLIFSTSSFKSIGIRGCYHDGPSGPIVSERQLCSDVPVKINVPSSIYAYGLRYVYTA